MTQSIVVVGSINYDVFLDVAALPRPNETLIGTGMRTAIGGKGLNQAVACAAFGVPTHMVGATGGDSFGVQAVAHLAAHGVTTDLVRTLPQAATGVANILVAGDGQNMIVVTPGANALLSPADIDAAAPRIAAAAAVVVQLEVPLPAVRRALEIARAHGVLTVINPAPVDRDVIELLPLCDLVTPNETELMRLTGITDLGDAALHEGLARLLAAGARQAVVTLGAEGCATLIDGHLLRLPAFRVKSIDATGAGDIFNGALVARLIAGQSLPAAMRFAAAAAAISVTRASADSAPTADEVADFLTQQTG